MSYQVTRVEFFGLPNRRVWIKPELDDQIARRMKELQPVLDARVRSVACWPNRSTQPLFLYRFPDGSLIYVLGNRVEISDGPRIDPSGELEKWALEAMESGARVGGVACRRCAPGEPSGNPFRCPCDGPIDLSEWGLATAIISNNCYSFARRTRWCGDGQGSQPGNRESADERGIRDGLRDDGLVRVEEHEMLTGTGDFVALWLGGAANYHFLRLDGDRWTHMPNGYPAVACDARGRAIFKGQLQQADMQGLRFLDYYRVPPDRPLTHCRA